jgi:predicted NAD/FAD-binding protein
MRIAVVGTGVSGLVAARLLCDEHDVHVFESERVAGGHALTIPAEAFGGSHPVDVGFMVYNERTYPNFVELLKFLDVPTRESDMSFSVRCNRTGQEYNGSSLGGFFARRSNLFRPSHYRMLADVLKFFREAPRDVEGLAADETLGHYVERNGYSHVFRSLYLLPMAASIWSAPPQNVLDFPAHFLIRFFRNHGLLQVANHPTWRTIVGGSTVYVNAISQPYRDRMRLNTPVRAVRRTEHGAIVVTDQAGEEAFDAVIMATHADITLRLLQDADVREREILEAFPYQENTAVLHTDAGLLPRRKQAWASWNYLVPGDASLPVAITYDLSRLQGHKTPTPICLTLNRGTEARPETILRELSFHHPLFGTRSLPAQARHDEINACRNTYFCGAYWGNGFHEDGVNSALVVARRFGKSLQTCKAASTKVA